MSLPLALHLAQSFGTAGVKDCSTSEAESLLQNLSLRQCCLFSLSCNNVVNAQLLLWLEQYMTCDSVRIVGRD